MSVFLPAQIIRAKRNGKSLSEADIRRFVEGIGAGEVSEAQIAAFTMACFLNGMAPEETAALTLAMRDSGEVIDWTGAGIDPRTIIDKHSSGGTGDEKVSLILAPLVASCGIHMPMISARGLGHTGGEVDLMEAIPGASIAPSTQMFRQAVMDAGVAIIGPTTKLAPADAAIYYVRDVTATVESIPLITASILSKKLASGVSGLVMSVNYGSGAFMPTYADADELAGSLISVARLAGLPMVAPIVEMDEVMGDAIGSRLQLREAIDFLAGRRQEPRMRALVMDISAEILVMAGLAASTEEAAAMLEKRLAQGSALERFSRMVAALGGPADLVENAGSYFPPAPFVSPLPSPTSGFVRKVDAYAVGLAMVGLGAGRKIASDALDHDVGLTGIVHVGDVVEKGEPLCILHCRCEAAVATAAEAISAAILIGRHQPERRPVVTGRLSTSD
ncbi:thymidine phosphorylase [Rhizobium sullae]|uniref:thymidine phosphorylase n=1 Tax=Rhizobium sullae TaxID=50338 RepID=A0A2N0D727_RHISU|nr:thymidine phosphorylase [Rhizobium sullae]PKA41899.1 thymidine phosphorylase [Rhizobium sullae]UWU13606.1 thymidine phosphorylase [Rhizobium sullae]